MVVSRRKYGVRNQRFGKGFITFLLIVVLAVGLGYTLTKFVITPYLLGDEDLGAGDVNSEDQDFSGSSIITDQQDIKEGSPQNGSASVTENTGDVSNQSNQTIGLYCIQFGSFSEKEGADTAVANLKASSIDTIVLQNDGSYKVIGTPFIQEEEAREALASMKPIAGEEIFITTMEAWMK